MSIIEKTVHEKIESIPVPVALRLASGRIIGEASAAVTLTFHDARALALVAAGRVGALGEAIVEGRIDVKGCMRDVMAAATALLPNEGIGSRPEWWRRIVMNATSALHHTRQRDAAQIAFHYDVSDDFYALWLDPRRVYSCAYYRTAEMDLAQAQEAKLDHICRKLDLQAGERFLDIGAGWGGLLLWAAENYGVDATGITLSKNQHAYVNRLIAERGLGDRVRMELRDYRDLDRGRPFDKIASVGMFEHVGRAHMGLYFRQLYDLLRPGGLILNHGITAGALDDAPVAGGLGDFIEKYIFPGGELIHVSQVLRELAASGLEMTDTENLRPHYARTLWAWSDALEAQLPQAERILAASGDTARAQRVLRAYRLYLAGCAAGFENNWISLYQVLAARPDGDVTTGAITGAQSDYPFTRDYIYS